MRRSRSDAIAKVTRINPDGFSKPLALLLYRDRGGLAEARVPPGPSAPALGRCRRSLCPSRSASSSHACPPKRRKHRPVRPSCTRSSTTALSGDRAQGRQAGEALQPSGQQPDSHFPLIVEALAHLRPGLLWRLIYFNCCISLTALALWLAESACKPPAAYTAAARRRSLSWSAAPSSKWQ